MYSIDGVLIVGEGKKGDAYEGGGLWWAKNRRLRLALRSTQDWASSRLMVLYSSCIVLDN